MEGDELGSDLVRLENGYLVDDDTYVVNSDDVLDQEENNSDSNSGGKNVPLREQDRFLPIANIAKIMKRAIPKKGKIAKDARECVQECISEFISFITSEASDRCQMEKRKTINGEDVLFAMNALGFDNYVEPLKIYLKKYREIVLSPVTVNKLNRVMYGSECQGYSDRCSDKMDGINLIYESLAILPTENDGETQTETVVYNYPKVIGEYTIT